MELYISGTLLRHIFEISINEFLTLWKSLFTKYSYATEGFTLFLGFIFIFMVIKVIALIIYQKKVRL